MRQSEKAGSRPSLVDIATEKIRDRILDLTLAPRSQIDENFLRDKLGISRTPAREALSRLVTEGLVENARGFFVRPLGLRETAQFFDAYIIVERSSAMLCRFANKALAKDLRVIQEKHGRSVENNAFLDITKHNADFHLRIAGATENSFLFEHANRMHNLARRLAFFIYANESENENFFKKQQDSVVNEHDVMIDCIERMERVGLVNITTIHAVRLRSRIANYIMGGPTDALENIVGTQDLVEVGGRDSESGSVVAIGKKKA